MHLVSSKNSIDIIRNTLNHVDSRLSGHGEKVSFIVHKILQSENKRDNKEQEALMLLGLFHDIGAYKTEDIQNMIQFESVDYWGHSIYGYLFLKNLSPLSNYADAVMFHHLPYTYYKKKEINLPEDAAAGLLQFADRVDVVSSSLSLDECRDYIKNNRGKIFSPYWVDQFIEADKHADILKTLYDKSYADEFEKIISKCNFSIKERKQFLKMVAYSIDFRSEVTVIHTITSVSVSMAMAKIAKLSSVEKKQIYYGSLLHDIGKVATPIEILEKKGKLTDDEMQIMKQHVTLTRQLLKGRLDHDIVEIAARHHERMDGSGYPLGLTEKDLTVSQCIVATADVISALVQRRSYKEAFTPEHTIAILRNMAEQHKLNAWAVNLAVTHFNEIMKESAKNEKEVLEMYKNMGIEYKNIMLPLQNKNFIVK